MTFDPESHVTKYRQVVAQRDAAKTNTERAKFEAQERKLRNEWKQCHGEDGLYEAAFGEPEE